MTPNATENGTGPIDSRSGDEPPKWEFYHWHPAAERAYQLLVESLLFRDRDGSPRGLRIIGESRAGKSSFLRNALLRLAVECPALALGFFSSQPPAESRLVDQGLRQRYLEAAHHPMASMHAKGSQLNSLSDRIWERCTGFAWDEAHLFYSQKSPHFIAQSANLLRLQMNQRKLPFILLGTDIVDLYVQSPELNNRFRPRAELTRFTIDTDTNEQEFRDQLTALESAAPLTFIPSLSERRMVYRTFCACDGLTGYLMDIMERAINRALRANQTIIELDDLEKAFADEFSERASVFNPFSEHTDDELIREIAKRALNLKAIGAASRKQGRQK